MDNEILIISRVGHKTKVDRHWVVITNSSEIETFVENTSFKGNILGITSTYEAALKVAAQFK